MSLEKCKTVFIIQSHLNQIQSHLNKNGTFSSYHSILIFYYPADTILPTRGNIRRSELTLFLIDGIVIAGFAWFHF